jgi:hypothetical protein
MPNLVVGIGVDIFRRRRERLFGRCDNRDRFYTEARYAF